MIEIVIVSRDTGFNDSTRRESGNVVTNNQCLIRKTSFIFWNVEKFLLLWHKKVVILLSIPCCLCSNMRESSGQDLMNKVTSPGSWSHLCIIWLHIQIYSHAISCKRTWVICVLSISHHFLGMFVVTLGNLSVTLPIKQLEDAIVSVNQSGSRKMLPPLPGARDKFAPFVQNLFESTLRHFENRDYWKFPKIIVKKE